MFVSFDTRLIDNKFWTETCRHATFIFVLFPDIWTLHTFSGSFYKLHVYCDTTRYGCKITNDTVSNNNDCDNNYGSFNEFRWPKICDSHIPTRPPYWLPGYVRESNVGCYPCVRHDLWVRHCTVDKRRSSDILEVWVCEWNGEVFVYVEVLIVR